MSKITYTQLADFLDLNKADIKLGITLVDISDPDGAYTHLEDMGEFGAAEAVSEIYFEHGGLKNAIQACKESLGLNDSISENSVRKMIKSNVKKLIK